MQKKFFTRALLGCALVSVTSASRADYYVLSATPDRPVNSRLPAHLLFMGAPNELGKALFDAVATRLSVLSSQFPERQVLAYVPMEPIENIDEVLRKPLIAKGVKAGDRETAWIKGARLHVVSQPRGTLGSAEMAAIASQFGSIEGFEVFSHASWPSGAAMGTKDWNFRFPLAQPIANMYATGNPDVRALHPGIAALAPRFSPNAFAALWGCNSGFTLAPLLSRAWGIPVLGSLSFTDFERLHADGRFYMTGYGYPNPPLAEGQAKPFASYPWAPSTTAFSQGDTYDCSRGCLRMKPNNFPYSGVWGNYGPSPEKDPLDLNPDPTKRKPQYRGGGLGFFKAFCDFAPGFKMEPREQRRVIEPRFPWERRRVETYIVNVKVQTDPDMTRCYRGMGHLAMSWTSPEPLWKPVATGGGRAEWVPNNDFRAYKIRVLDFLCPNDNRDARYAECIRTLEAAEEKRPSGYSPFKGNPLECGWSGCQGRFVYRAPGDEVTFRAMAPQTPAGLAAADEEIKKWGSPAYGMFQKSVRIDAPVVASSKHQTLINEYLAYLDAYGLYTGRAIPVGLSVGDEMLGVNTGAVKTSSAGRKVAAAAEPEVYPAELLQPSATVVDDLQ